MTMKDDQHKIQIVRKGRLIAARKALLTAKGLKNSAAQAAELLDIDDHTYRAYERDPGGSKSIRITYELAKQLAPKLGVTVGYLMADEEGGLPVRHDDPEEVLAAKDQLPTSSQQDGMVSIPAYDIKLAAGGGYYVDEPELSVPWVLPKSFITGSLGLNPETLSVVEVVGISMTPTLLPRDRVLIDHSDTNPSPPGVFAIWDGSGLLIKNVSRTSPKFPEMIVITSDNPSYPPINTTLEEITIIGRVKWFGRGI